MDNVWKLDNDPGSSRALWFSGSNVYTSDPDLATAFLNSGSGPVRQPYPRKLQLVTLHVNGKDNTATLLIDGIDVISSELTTTSKKDGAAAASAATDGEPDVLVVNPHFADEEAGTGPVFAPMAFSMLLDDGAEEPHEATVELVDTADYGERILQKATLKPTRRTDASAPSAILPFPAPQQPQEAKLVWTQAAGRSLNLTSQFLIKTERSLGQLSEAMKRVHSALLAAKSRGERPVTAPLEVLAKSLADGETSSKYTLEFESVSDEDIIDSFIRISIAPRAGDKPIQWKLAVGSDSRRAVLKYYRRQTSLLSIFKTKVAEVVDNYNDSLTPPVDAKQQWVAARLTQPFEDVLPGIETTTDAASSNFKTLRVWGPVLKSAALDGVPAPLPEGSGASGTALRSAMNQLRRAKAQFEAPGPTYHLVTWHEDVPSDSRLEIAASAETTDGGADDLVPPVTRLGAYIDPMRMVGGLPIGVACSTGAFKLDGHVSELDARRELGGRNAPVLNADVLRKLGLNHTPEAISALEAYSDVLVHLCASRQAEFDNPANSVQSAILLAATHVRFAAGVIKELYTKASDDAFITHTDARFFTMAGAATALVCIRHFPAWKAFVISTERKRIDGVEWKPTWSATCRQSTAAFVAALDKLSSASGPSVHPVLFPYLPMQALWQWPLSLHYDDENVRVDGTPLEHLRRGAAMAAKPRISERTDIAQFVAAKQSISRVDIMVEAFKISDETSAAIRRAIIVSRPSVTVGSFASDPLLESINDGEEEQKKFATQRRVKLVDTGVLRASWARKSMGTYKTWKIHDADVEKAYRADGVDGAVDAMTALSLENSVASPVAYFVPYGATLGSSPLTGPNLAFSENAVWIAEMATFLYSDNDSVKGSLAAKLSPLFCIPREGSIFLDATTPRSEGNYPDPFVVTRTVTTDQKTVISVPVCLTSFDFASDGPAAAIPANRAEMLSSAITAVKNSVLSASTKTLLLERDKSDHTRCVMFTAERIMQSLLMCMALGVANVELTVDKKLNRDPLALRLLVSSVSISIGMLPSVFGDPKISVTLSGEGGPAAMKVRDALIAPIEALSAAGLGVAPLVEVASVIAAWTLKTA